MILNKERMKSAFNCTSIENDKPLLYLLPKIQKKIFSKVFKTGYHEMTVILDKKEYTLLCKDL